jgi:hypothetical protein
MTSVESGLQRAVTQLNEEVSASEAVPERKAKLEELRDRLEPVVQAVVAMNQKERTP